MVADAVVVLHLAPVHDGECCKSAVRVVRKACIPAGFRLKHTYISWTV